MMHDEDPELDKALAAVERALQQNPMDPYEVETAQNRLRAILIGNCGGANKSWAAGLAITAVLLTPYILAFQDNYYLGWGGIISVVYLFIVLGFAGYISEKVRLKAEGAALAKYSRHLAEPDRTTH